MEIFYRDPDYVWTHASPSQVETFERCKRKWWFEKPGRLEGIVSARQQWNFDYGSECHEAIELHLNGEPGPLQSDRYWEEASGYLDRIRPDVLATELGCNFEVCEGQIRIKSIIDVVTIDGIIDHKTTSDRKYAKTKDQLKGKRQTQLYGLYYLRHFDPDAPGVYVRLNYIQKPPAPGTGNKRFAPANWQVEHYFERGALEEIYEKELRPILLDMQEHASVDRHTDVEPTYSACSKFGGCPFQDICHQTKRRRFANIQRSTRNRETLMGKFNAKKFLKKAKGAAGAPIEDVDESEDPSTAAKQKLAKLKLGGTGNEKADPSKAEAVPRSKFKRKDPADAAEREAAEEAKAAEELAALVAKYERLLGHYEDSTLQKRGIVDPETLEIDLLEATKFLWEYNEIETTPLELPHDVKHEFAQWRKAIRVSSGETRDNHPSGASIDDKTGDVITDLQKAADVPNNGVTPTLYKFVTGEWGFTVLADFASCTESQLLDIDGIGPKTVRELIRFLESRDIVLGSKARYEEVPLDDGGETTPKEEDVSGDTGSNTADDGATPAAQGGQSPSPAAEQGGFTIEYERKVNDPDDNYAYTKLRMEGHGGSSMSTALVNLRELRQQIDEMAEESY